MGHINESCIRVHQRSANLRMIPLDCVFVKVVEAFMPFITQLESQTWASAHSTESKARVRQTWDLGATTFAVSGRAVESSVGVQR